LIWRGELMKKKLKLSKETLRTLDDDELTQVAGGNKTGLTQCNAPTGCYGCCTCDCCTYTCCCCG